MTDAVEAKQAVFEGWAIVEMMGHRKEIGFVTTQAFGPAVLFRVDVPELPEREFTLTRPEYVSGQYVPIGTKVKRSVLPARSCLVAVGSLYAINPCSEEAARTAIERSIERPLIVLELPEGFKTVEDLSRLFNPSSIRESQITSGAYDDDGEFDLEDEV